MIVAAFTSGKLDPAILSASNPAPVGGTLAEVQAARCTQGLCIRTRTHLQSTPSGSNGRAGWRKRGCAV